MNKLNQNVNLSVQNDQGCGLFHYWFGTYNNPPNDWKAALSDFQADFAIGQLEKGTNGTPHIQFLLYWASAKRTSHFRGSNCWIEGISAKDACEKVAFYVQKSKTRLEGPIKFGVKPRVLPLLKPEKQTPEQVVELAKEGRIDEIDAGYLIRNLGNLLKIAMLKPASRLLKECCGLWITGPPNCGKTHSVLVDDETGEINPNVFVKDDTIWWDGYLNHQIVLLDELDINGKAAISQLKKWADKFRDKGQVKGGYVRFTYSTFVVTSNYLPEDIISGDETFLRALKRRFKFRIYYGHRKFVDGGDFGEYPLVPDTLNTLSSQ